MSEKDVPDGLNEKCRTRLANAKRPTRLANAKRPTRQTNRLRFNLPTLYAHELCRLSTDAYWTRAEPP
jgi:hypothetical protein